MYIVQKVSTWFPFQKVAQYANGEKKDLTKNMYTVKNVICLDSQPLAKWIVFQSKMLHTLVLLDYVAFCLRPVGVRRFTACYHGYILIWFYNRIPSLMTTTSYNQSITGDLNLNQTYRECSRYTRMRVIDQTPFWPTLLYTDLCYNVGLQHSTQSDSAQTVMINLICTCRSSVVLEILQCVAWNTYNKTFRLSHRTETDKTAVIKPTGQVVVL